MEDGQQGRGGGLSHVINNDCYPAAGSSAEKVTEQAGLPRSKKPRNNRHWEPTIHLPPCENPTFTLVRNVHVLPCEKANAMRNIRQNFSQS